jgi:hypothetical protein
MEKAIVRGRVADNVILDFHPINEDLVDRARST